MKPSDLLKNILNDTKIQLKSDFLENFREKGFFGTKWKQAKIRNSRGTLMRRTSGGLYHSIDSKINGNRVVFFSSLPYASIHNEGGKIKVTAKMKRFFWAMYYKASGAISKSYNLKNGDRVTFVSSDSKKAMLKQQKSKKARDQRMNKEAEIWKSLALKKVGDTVTIEQRQFIGEHPQVTKRIEDIVKFNVEEYNKQLFKNLKK